MSKKRVVLRKAHLTGAIKGKATGMMMSASLKANGRNIAAPRSKTLSTSREWNSRWPGQSD